MNEADMKEQRKQGRYESRNDGRNQGKDVGRSWRIGDRCVEDFVE